MYRSLTYIFWISELPQPWFFLRDIYSLFWGDLSLLPICQHNLPFLTPLVFSEPDGRWSVLSPVPSLCHRGLLNVGLYSSISRPFMISAQSLPFLTLPQYLQCCGVRWKVVVKASFAAVLPLGVLVEIPWISAEASSSPSFLASE